MFTTAHNPVQHTVKAGACQFCKLPFPGSGVVYTKESSILTFQPSKFTVCKGVK
jgi:hypothetical protein